MPSPIMNVLAAREPRDRADGGPIAGEVAVHTLLSREQQPKRFCATCRGCPQSIILRIWRGWLPYRNRPVDVCFLAQDVGSLSESALAGASRTIADVVESVAEQGLTLGDAAAVSVVSVSAPGAVGRAMPARGTAQQRPDFRAGLWALIYLCKHQDSQLHSTCRYCPSSSTGHRCRNLPLHLPAQTPLSSERKAA